MKNLPVPILKQETKFDCGPTCVLMAMEYLGEKLDYVKFSEGIIKVGGKINIFDLAEKISDYTERKIFIQTFNYHYLEDTFNTLSLQEKREMLEDLTTKKEHTNIFQALQRCLHKKQIVIEHKLFTLKDIERSITKDIPLIAFVSLQELRKVKLKEWHGHFIIIKGFDETHFYYNNPYWADQKSGDRKIEKVHLYASILKTAFPSILEIEK